MKTLCRQIFCWVVLATLLLTTNESYSQSPDPEVIENAKREGHVVWYTTMNLDTSKEIINRFHKKHPSIKPELMRTGGGILLNRILTEARGGRYAWDVALGRGEIFLPLKKRKLVIPYRSREAAMYPDDLKDADGYWIAAYVNPNVLGFNTELVKEQAIPRSYEDLLNPRWKGGKLSLDTEGWALLSGLSQAWGEEKAVAYFKKIATQDPLLKRGNSLRAQLVAAGESPLGIAYAGTLQVLVDQGAPLDWVPLEPVVVQAYPIMIGAKAPHPNAARLFVDFILSKESQELIRDFARIPSRSDTDPKPSRLIQFKRIVQNPNEITRFNETVRRFNRIFGLR